MTPNCDSIPAVENVQIKDTRFATSNGVSIKSTFKDNKEKYKIKKIITSLNNGVILLKENDLYFTIDTAELPASLRYKANATVEEVQIPDNAKIKYMMVGWD
jgi:hypothetical protein